MFSYPRYTQSAFLSTQIIPTTPPPADNTTCTICTEEYDTFNHEPATYAGEESCGHVFCMSCLVTWLSGPTTNSCAMCRRQLFLLPGEQLYSDNFDEYGEEPESDSESESESDSESDSQSEHGDEQDDRIVNAIERLSTLLTTIREDAEDILNEPSSTSPVPSQEDVAHVRTYPPIVHDLLQRVFYKLWRMLEPYRHLPILERNVYVSSTAELRAVFSETLFLRLDIPREYVVPMTVPQADALQLVLCRVRAALMMRARRTSVRFPEHRMRDWAEILSEALPWLWRLPPDLHGLDASVVLPQMWGVPVGTEEFGRGLAWPNRWGLSVGVDEVNWRDAR